MIGLGVPVGLAVVWFAIRRRLQSKLPRLSDEAFVSSSRHYGLELEADALLKYRRSLARCMGVPSSTIRLDATIEDYAAVSFNGLVAQPFDLMDDVVASLERLGRGAESAPRQIAEIIKLFVADDAARTTRPHR